MKRIFLIMVTAACLAACNVLHNPVSPEIPDDPDKNGKLEVPVVDNPITLASPQPAEYIDKLTISKEQKGYIDTGNTFAFNCMNHLYLNEPGSMVYSPLSLMYALAMSVNGASGETAAEITRTLGYGTDVNALNEYCKLLLDQLPALDKYVKISLADAMIVKEPFRLVDSFQATMRDNYYSPVEYFQPSDTKVLVDRINEWAYRNTNGLVYPVVSDKDLEDAMAVIINALYFEAPWATNYSGGLIFTPETTKKKQPFYLEGDKKISVDLMQARKSLPYVEKEDYQIVAIPYSYGKYCMYVLLPKFKGKDALKKLLQGLPSEDWRSICSSLTTDAEIHLSLPKFTIENKFHLVKTLNAMGISRAFSFNAEFNSMFNSPATDFKLSNLIQKAKITVDERGTEAGAVTILAMDGAAKVKTLPVVEFCADHPFVYIIAEKDSGVILFEGVFDGE